MIEGWAIGGGLAIAACCDLRIATPGSKLRRADRTHIGELSVGRQLRAVGVPLGMPRAKRMLLMAVNARPRTMPAAGFLMAVVDPAALDQNITEICERLAGNAPVTMRVTTRERCGGCRWPAFPTATICAHGLWQRRFPRGR